MYRLLFCLITTLAYAASLNAQSVSWQDRAALPEAVTNNAVTGVMVDGQWYVYSFAGIDTTKACGAAHLRSFRYDVSSDTWDTIAPLPDVLGGKLAAGASTVKGEIYIIGGYHVAENCEEVSSKKVHRYDPVTESYLPDGADIPVAIDDHVQAVWRDSLIFVVTGWSNTTNVRNVQIYNPATDTWSAGTNLPNSFNWKVFGASGEIVGDTLYYIGGASPNCSSSNCFPPTDYLRKGYINPEDPTDITWMGEEVAAAQGYRMAASSFQDQPIWIGGSDLTYNFDGIDYNGTGGVAALNRITVYRPETGALDQVTGDFPARMDFRGLAKISAHEYILAGGMLMDQVVTGTTIKLTIDDLTAVVDLGQSKITVFPNPATDQIRVVHELELLSYELLSVDGKILLKGSLNTPGVIDVRGVPGGLCLLRLRAENGDQITTKVIVK